MNVERASGVRLLVEAVLSPHPAVEFLNLVNTVQQRCGLHRLKVQQNLLSDACEAFDVPLSSLRRRRPTASA